MIDSEHDSDGEMTFLDHFIKKSCKGLVREQGNNFF